MEEFILCIPISMCAFYERIKGLFLGIMVGYIFHCFMHFSVKISIVKLLRDGLVSSLLIIVNLFFLFQI